MLFSVVTCALEEGGSPCSNPKYLEEIKPTSGRRKGNLKISVKYFINDNAKQRFMAFDTAFSCTYTYYAQQGCTMHFNGFNVNNYQKQNPRNVRCILLLLFNERMLCVY